jgi:hypothetical protein
MVFSWENGGGAEGGRRVRTEVCGNPCKGGQLRRLEVGVSGSLAKVDHKGSETVSDRRRCAPFPTVSRLSPLPTLYGSLFGGDRTSIQGASQAVEDGVTLAVILQLAGQGDVPLAVRSWEKIRYQRVRRAQLMGESTRDMWHKAKPSDKGAAVELPRPEWLLGFDAEKYAYDEYEVVAKDILDKGYVLPVLPTL